MKANLPTKLLWLDLEMTGLEVEQDRIIEVGVIVTDFDFKELDTFEAIIYQPPKILARMKDAPWYDWSQGKRTPKGTVFDMHSANGLIEKIKTSKLDEQAAETALIKFTEKHFDTPAILAGNSIHFDRRFIIHWWPILNDKLHYRMLDVSAYKILMQSKYKVDFKKPDSHRALGDIRGSISELQYYLRKLKQK